MQRSQPAGAADDVTRSPANQTIKKIRSLRQRKAREAERVFVVEGFRAIADAIAAGASPRVILVREGDEVAAETWLGSSQPMRTVSAPVFDQLAETVTPQGAIAVFPMPSLSIPQLDNPLYLVVDQVRDPGNLGTLLRAAAGAGVTAVVLAEGTVDPFNPKVVRAAMGAHFRIPIVWYGDEQRAIIERRCPVRVVADAAAERTYDEIDWVPGAAVIVGSEAYGATELGGELGTIGARIPLAAGIESLNAGVAGAIFLFEAARQRRRHVR